MYYKEHVPIPNGASSEGGRPMSSMSYREALISLCQTINFIENWLQLFEVGYENIIKIYKRNMSELFKKSQNFFLQKI